MPFLEVSEFNRMPAAGTINPCALRFAQPEVSRDFSDPRHGSVYDLSTALKLNPGLASNLPPLEIGEFGGYVWSFDTRRLVALQMAYVDAHAVIARYVKLNSGEVAARMPNFDPRGSRMGILVGVRQGGKHSTRLEHRNPEYSAEHYLASNLDMTGSEYKSNVRLLSQVSGVHVTPLDIQ